MKTSSPPVKAEASGLRIPIYQPKNITDRAAIERLKGFDADFFVVVAYGKILPKKILDIPRICALNIHASLLPKYRGAAPVNWALINGEDRTGVSIIRMNERMDAGDIVAQKAITIGPDDTSDILNPRLADLGAINI